MPKIRLEKNHFLEKIIISNVFSKIKDIENDQKERLGVILTEEIVNGKLEV